MNFKSMAQKLALAIYIAVIIKMTLIRGPIAELMDDWTYNTVLCKVSTANFEPLKTIKMYLNMLPSSLALLNLVGNVAGFIPLGYLLPLIFKKQRGLFRTSLTGLVSILFIETTQILTGLGEFDVDDILLNMVGVLLGRILYSLLNPKK